MSRLLVLIVYGLLLCRCSDSLNPDLEFNQIDYSYDNGWKEAFSLRLNQDGNCVIAKGRWLKNKKYFSCTVDLKTLQRIDSIYRNVLACNPDSVYKESMEDGGSYKIVSGQRSFYVYGGNEPACLKEFSSSLYALIETKLIPVDTVLDFKSLKSFYPPPVKIDTASFLPPER